MTTMKQNLGSVAPDRPLRLADPHHDFSADSHRSRRSRHQMLGPDAQAARRAAIPPRSWTRSAAPRAVRALSGRPRSWQLGPVLSFSRAGLRLDFRTLPRDARTFACGAGRLPGYRAFRPASSAPAAAARARDRADLRPHAAGPVRAQFRARPAADFTFLRGAGLAPGFRPRRRVASTASRRSRWARRSRPSSRAWCAAPCSKSCHSDYVRTARAKGLPERAVLFHHAFPNALIPIITIVGLQFGTLLAGTIVTETIFSWPGIGRLAVQAIQARDYPLLQGCILVIALSYVLVNLLTDLVYYAWSIRGCACRECRQSSSRAGAAEFAQPVPRRSRLADFLRRSPLGRWGLAMSRSSLLPAALSAPWIAPQPPSRAGFAGTPALVPNAAASLRHRRTGPRRFGAHPLRRTRFAARRISRGAWAPDLLGLAVGSLAGYFGGWFDHLVNDLLINAFLSFPGNPAGDCLCRISRAQALDKVILALVITGWAGYARLARAQALKVKEMEFVLAARSLGASHARILLRHLLPNTLPPVLIQATIGLASAILAESTLSFLGWACSAPTASWGAMLNDARNHLFDAPHMVVFPGARNRCRRAGVQFIGRRSARLARSAHPRLSAHAGTVALVLARA